MSCLQDKEEEERQGESSSATPQHRDKTDGERADGGGGATVAGDDGKKIFSQLLCKWRLTEPMNSEKRHWLKEAYSLLSQVRRWPQSARGGRDTCWVDCR